MAAIGLLGFVFCGLYAFSETFEGPLTMGGLPDISATFEEMTRDFQVVAWLGLGWTIALLVLSTPPWASSIRSRLRTAVAWERTSRWTLFAAIALAGAYAIVRFAFNGSTGYSTLVDLASGKAATPFQYRALVPWMLAGLRALPFVGSMRIEALAGLVEWAFAVGAWWACARLFRPYLGGKAQANVAALGVIVVLALNLATPWRYNNFFFPWDTPSVLAFALGLALLQEKKWMWYYVLFAVATVNRETTCFLTIAYALSSLGKVPLRTIAAHSLAQLAIWIAIKAGLLMLYAGNESLGLGMFLPTYVRSVWIVTAVPGLLYLVLAMGGTWAVVFGLRQRLAGYAFAPLFRVIPVFLLGMFFVGELMEIRIYSELIPLVTLGAAVALRSVVVEAAALSAASAAMRPAAMAA